MMDITAENKVNTMARDALAPCFANSGTSNILNENSHRIYCILISAETGIYLYK